MSELRDDELKVVSPRALILHVAKGDASRVFIHFRRSSMHRLPCGGARK